MHPPISIRQNLPIMALGLLSIALLAVIYFVPTWWVALKAPNYPPEAFPDGVPLARMGVEPRDMERVKADFDFLGINLYTRTLVRTDASSPIGALPAGAGGGNEGARTEFDWEVWPRALYDMVMRVTRDYDTPVLEITENGCSYGDAPDEEGVVHDDRRIEFYTGYLSALADAIADGADVRAYHAWSLLDNFEWSEGYAQRFGLVHVDFDSCDRTLKESGRWYARVAAENGYEIGDDGV